MIFDPKRTPIQLCSLKFRFFVLTGHPTLPALLALRRLVAGVEEIALAQLAVVPVIVVGVGRRLLALRQAVLPVSALHAQPHQLSLSQVLRQAILTEGQL